MNKLAKRAWFALALAGVLLLGMGVIVVRYFIDSPDWVTFQNSPHVYTDGVMNSGKIVDRGGTVVLDATNGKSYADSASLRRSMLHLLGDREGNITPFLLQEYGSELVGFDRINGTYSTGKREGRMMLTVSADVQRTALAALDGRKGTVGVYNYKTARSSAPSPPQPMIRTMCRTWRAAPRPTRACMSTVFCMPPIRLAPFSSSSQPRPRWMRSRISDPGRSPARAAPSSAARPSSATACTAR